MTREERVDKQKLEESLKYMHFNRFMMVRYLSAAYFFVNAAWALVAFSYQSWTLYIPLVMIVLNLLSSMEIAGKLQSKTTDAPKTTFYFLVQLTLNLLLGIICFTPLAASVFPFVSAKNARAIITMILLIGIFGAIMVLNRLQAVKTNSDKYYKVISAFKKNHIKN